MALHRFPRPVDAPADKHQGDVIDMLQGALAEAREGQFRSVAIVTVSDDGKAVGTRWAMKTGDTTTVIGKLTALIHDLLAARD